MGDRGQVEITYGPNEPKIYLYTHWGGTDLYQTVVKALIRGESRWTDGPYLTRIIIDQMTDGTRETTGVGIAPYDMGPDHIPIEINIQDQTIDGIKFAEEPQIKMLRTLGVS